jgi:hypothetical protein
MKPLKYILTILFLVNLASCIAYRNHQLPNVDTAILKTKPSKKVEVFVSWDFGTDSIADDLKPFYPLQNSINEGKKKRIEKLISDAKCCDLTTNKEYSDVSLEITFVPRKKPEGFRYFSEVISGSTIMIIPCWFTDEVRILAKATRKNYSKSYNLSDSVTTINWLPLIFAAPFTKKPWSLITETEDNLYKNLISQMIDDGFFN